MRVTIRQIAEESGVSRGTVDRVLNNRGKVRPEVEERVRKVAEELGYKPNLLGRALIKMKEYQDRCDPSGYRNALFKNIIGWDQEGKRRSRRFWWNCHCESGRLW